MPDNIKTAFLEKKNTGKKFSESNMYSTESTVQYSTVKYGECRLQSEKCEQIQVSPTLSLSLSLSLSVCPNQLVGNYRHFLFQIPLIFCLIFKYGFIFGK